MTWGIYCYFISVPIILTARDSCPLVRAVTKSIRLSRDLYDNIWKINTSPSSSNAWYDRCPSTLKYQSLRATVLAFWLRSEGWQSGSARGYVPKICSITVVTSFRDVIKLDKQMNGGQIEMYSKFGGILRQASSLTGGLPCHSRAWNFLLIPRSEIPRLFQP